MRQVMINLSHSFLMDRKGNLKILSFFVVSASFWQGCLLILQYEAEEDMDSKG